MGLFKKKRAVFIENAGGVIITKSIYQGTSKLKWLFREESVTGRHCGKAKRQCISDGKTEPGLDQVQADGG